MGSGAAAEYASYLWSLKVWPLFQRVMYGFANAVCRILLPDITQAIFILCINNGNSFIF
jgi:hypothetical protein